MNPARYVLVFANDGDQTASRFVLRHAREGVRLVTPRDLSRPGWRYEVRQGAVSAQALVGNETVPQERLAGVLTRLGCVTAMDIPHIQAGDRDYVAAEMQAFLVAWLHTLPCPVVNRPSAICLAGNWWSPQKWVQIASRLGIPVSPLEQRIVGHATRRRSPSASRVEAVTAVTVVGRRVVGTVAPRLADQARMLARAVGLEFVTVHFSSPAEDAPFVGATPWPDLAEVAIGDAVLRHLRCAPRAIPMGCATA